MHVTFDHCHACYIKFTGGGLIGSDYFTSLAICSVTRLLHIFQITYFYAPDAFLSKFNPCKTNRRTDGRTHPLVDMREGIYKFADMQILAFPKQRLTLMLVEICERFALSESNDLLPY